jgi:UPF0755 protein
MLDHDTTETPETEGSPPKRWMLVAGAAIAGALILFVGARFAANLVAGDPWTVQPGIPVEVTIAPGSSATSIYRTLDDAGVARSSELRDAARSAAVEDQLQAGTYALTTDMDPDEVVRILATGSSQALGGAFTVVEGWTIDRILDELDAQTPFSRSEYEAVLSSDAITSPLLPAVSPDVDPITRWEGLLYPARYPIGPNDTPETVLRQMTTEMNRRLDEVDWSRIDSLSISRYEAVIIGSLIQREAGTDEDRPLISSVIHNRLAEGMRLQIDATVVYAVGDVNGRVTAEDLKIESAYNTYKIDGLPPTPIGTVSLPSLAAAVNPEFTDYLFYVLANEDGSHAFARTYEEHQENVRAAKEAGVLP